jgi:gamma-glutamyltranspeptidase/glutathione hydrolase/leukotriene-C4 hydrolase
LTWRTLFQPAIKLDRDGFVVASYPAFSIAESVKKITNDPDLRQVFAPNAKLLKAGDKCCNLELA